MSDMPIYIFWIYTEKGRPFQPPLNVDLFCFHHPRRPHRIVFENLSKGFYCFPFIIWSAQGTHSSFGAVWSRWSTSGAFTFSAPSIFAATHLLTPKYSAYNATINAIPEIIIVILCITLAIMVYCVWGKPPRPQAGACHSICFTEPHSAGLSQWWGW